jgi:hypothetical protein
MKRVILLPAEKAGRCALIRYLVRLGIIAIIIWTLIVYLGIDLIGLLVGLSVLVINIIALLFHRLTINGG